MLLLLIAIFATGCIKSKQIVTVMPDGSGKIEVTLGVKELAPENPKTSALDKYTLERMYASEMFTGIVAVTKPKRWQEADFKYVRFTIYFNDINRFAGPGGEEGRLFATYKLTDLGEDGQRLTVTGGATMSILDTAREADPLLSAIYKQKIEGYEGFHFVESFILPSEADTIKGLAMVDNTVTAETTNEDLLKGTGLLQDLKDAEAIELTYFEKSIEDSVIDAFAKEKEQAVKEWQDFLRTQKK
ncbi:MAG: hypothetical protein AAGI37_14475 [Planctomycetota bacterium]